MDCNGGPKGGSSNGDNEIITKSDSTNVISYMDEDFVDGYETFNNAYWTAYGNYQSPTPQGTPNGAQNILEKFNYRIGPQSSQRIYYSNWYIWDLEVSWLPSITFDNESSVTLGSDGFDFDLGDGPVTGSMSLSDDGIDFGYMSSPFVDDWNSATGMSISTPRLFQPYAVSTTTHTSVGRGGVTFDTDLTVTMRIRQDQTSAGGVIAIFAATYGMGANFVAEIIQKGEQALGY